MRTVLHQICNTSYQEIAQRLRHRTLFGVCLFSACRIRECCTLQTQDIQG
ncbi:hypothetical protein [Nostoc sp.]